jgi:hypothetical protein
MTDRSYRRRVMATPSMKATARLDSGASRVMALMIANGFPGRLASASTVPRRSTAALSAPVTSPIVRDTSVAVSMARSAIPG